MTTGASEGSTTGAGHQAPAPGAENPVASPAGIPDSTIPDSTIRDARNGDARALDELVAAVQDSVFRLALRMVTRPGEAEDATQEILIKVITRLSSFRQEAAFTTWVHRIAVNHLLDRKKSSVERMQLNFDAYAEDIHAGLAASDPGPESDLLATEVRLSCTQAMLTCLDREHRIAYVLGEVFQVSSADGSYVSGVSAEAYRKRLSRARGRVRAFVEDNCGLVNEHAACRCRRRVETAVKLGRIDPENLELVVLPAAAGVIEMERLYDAASLLRSHPRYLAPSALRQRIRDLVTSNRFALLADQASSQLS